MHCSYRTGVSGRRGCSVLRRSGQGNIARFHRARTNSHPAQVPSSDAAAAYFVEPSRRCESVASILSFVLSIVPSMPVTDKSEAVHFRNPFLVSHHHHTHTETDQRRDMREVDFRDLLNFRSISEMPVSWCAIVSDSNLPYPSDHAAFTMRSLASRVGRDSLNIVE